MGKSLNDSVAETVETIVGMKSTIVHLDGEIKKGNEYIEKLSAENGSLRAELNAANVRIAELESSSVSIKEDK